MLIEGNMIVLTLLGIFLSEKIVKITIIKPENIINRSYD